MFYSKRLNNKINSIHEKSLRITYQDNTVRRKWSFLLRISPVNVTKSAVSGKLVKFTGEILNGKFHFLCTDASTFQELLNEEHFVSIRHINVHLLATEMFKVPLGLSSEILLKIFVSKTSAYNLRRNWSLKNVKIIVLIIILNLYLF